MIDSMVAAEEDGGVAYTVREFDGDRDRDSAAVERLEQACEVGPSGGKLCLFTDLLGDPLCRVRHSPAYLMLVAEAADGPLGTEIVGVVRGCVKTVACGRGQLFSKVAYLLGLRVSPAHRRRGIGRKLVERMEEWFRQMGAEYAYVATDTENEPSVRLFTARCGYAKFRTPSVLVHPVFRHDLAPSPRAAVVQLAPREAELLYRRRFADVEFFPRDIDAVLSNALSLGTLLALPEPGAARSWRGVEAFLAAPPESWAVASVWNCKDAFRLEVRGAPRLWRAAARATRAADRAAPWLGIPSVPNLFDPFGMHFLYGLGGAGPSAPRLARALCRHAHNVARRAGARVVATEVGACDPLRAGVPHWPRLGAEDLWCIKRLTDSYGDGTLGDWTKAPPGASIFVDPREF
ncbi:probable N-acetyltransferase HLS1 [Phragmites australis]|uniref:probable N-acetyltransferase HLS1 n=1 Tax=Phragmites australis TaxID=29695 RepID=UPI002D77294A|nr:probable N-acetyltransferase HLS1 [Phragmites australis]